MFVPTPVPFIINDDMDYIDSENNDFVFVLIVDRNHNGNNMFKKLKSKNDMDAIDESKLYVKNYFGFIHYKTLGFKRKKLYPFNVYMFNKKYLDEYKDIEYDISVKRMEYITTNGIKIV